MGVVELLFCNFNIDRGAALPAGHICHRKGTMVIAWIGITRNTYANAQFVIPWRPVNGIGIDKRQRIRRRFHRIQLALIRLIIMRVLIKVVVDTKAV